MKFNKNVKKSLREQYKSVVALKSGKTQRNSGVKLTSSERKQVSKAISTTSRERGLSGRKAVGNVNYQNFLRKQRNLPKSERVSKYALKGAASKYKINR